MLPALYPCDHLNWLYNDGVQTRTTKGFIMLSNKWLNSKLNKPQEKEITKAHSDGLYARVRKSGSISFIFRYRYNGKGDKITIGKYPDLSLADARLKAIDYQKMIANNLNPKREIERSKFEYDQDVTVAQVFESWWHYRYKDHPQYNSEKGGTPLNNKRSYENYIDKKLGKQIWDDIPLKAWSDLFKDIFASVPSIASNLVTCMSSAGTYGVQSGTIQTNCIETYSAAKTLGYKRKKGKRILSFQEIEMYYSILDKGRYDHRAKIIFKLLLIYGCRCIELRKAKSEHFDFVRNLWTVPAEIAKPRDSGNVDDTGKPIVRPIIPETKAMFEELIELSEPNANGYLFVASSGPNKGEPLSETAWTSVPIRLTEKAQRIQGELLDPWSKHDLRRTMRTLITGFKYEDGKNIEPWLAELMLGHKLGGVFADYDKGDYIQEKKTAYQIWFNVLDNIWSGASNVIELDEKRKAAS